ncbi:MAG: hypothetical protein ACOCP8_01050 [archaeon]
MNATCIINSTQDFFSNTTTIICNGTEYVTSEPILFQNITIIGWIAIAIYLIMGYIIARKYTPLTEHFAILFIFNILFGVIAFIINGIIIMFEKIFNKK